MNIKGVVKSMIGMKNWNNMVATAKYAKSLLFFIQHPNQKKFVQPSWKMSTLSVAGCHTFFGYYDLAELDHAEKRALAHVVALNADTSKDAAQIGYFDLNTGAFHKVSETRAWCWQQGARLRWHPLNQDWLMFNQMVDGKYVTQIWNTKDNRLYRQIQTPMYDVDAAFTYGLSLNFSRLQRLRPGYGYKTVADATIRQNAPADDGIFYVDLKSETKTLLVSLKEVAQKVDPEMKLEHYFNHISIAPDGKRFMFFHIWNLPGNAGWRTCLYVYDLETSTLTALEKTDMVSHYDWQGSQAILVTCFTKEKKQYYALYDVKTGSKTIVGEDVLNRDGHPSFMKGDQSFVSDTYPLAHNQQHLFSYDMTNGKKTELLTLYSSPLRYGEKRCDMHPRLSESEKYITLDSTFSQNRRKIVVMRSSDRV